MKTKHRGILGIALAALASLPPASAQLAVRAAELWTLAPGADDPIRDGVVLVDAAGRIERVGAAAEVEIPANYRRLEARVATPGLVDAHTVVGLSGIYNVAHDQDQLDKTAPIQPELRAIDAYNAREALVDWVRGFGVTTIHTGHGPGAIASGQTLVAKTAPGTVDEVTIRPAAMVAFTLGPEVGSNFDSPGTRSKGVALLRAELVRAREYAAKRSSGGDKVPDRDLRLEALAQVLSGELPALVTAQRVPEILAALRLREEFGFRLVLDGAAEIYQVLDRVKDAGVPVVLHPPMARLSGPTVNASLETPARLAALGISFALQSGFEAYVPKTRVVLFEAAVAAANGLGFERALASVTIDAARIVGVDDRVGSLEPGKDGDLALFDGDPFEYVTHVCAVVIEGRVVSETCH